MILSFGGTIGIIFFLGNLETKQVKNKKEDTNNKQIVNKIITYIKETSRVCISAQIIIFPIMAYTYKTISLTFIITNILTSYLIGIIIIFGFIISLISFPMFNLARIIGKIYKLLIDVLVFITKTISKISISKIYIKAPYFWAILLYYILVFSIFYLHRKSKLKSIIKKLYIIIRSNYMRIISMVLIFLIFLMFIYIIPKNLEIYFIDVRTRRCMSYYNATWKNNINRPEEELKIMM